MPFSLPNLQSNLRMLDGQIFILIYLAINFLLVHM